MLGGLLGLVELAVSIKSFINIELQAQGWYAVRLRVPLGPGVKAVWPASVVNKGSCEPDAPAQSKAWAVEPGGFRSTIYEIQYCYEEVDLAETFVLHLYLDAKDMDKIGLNLEFELMFMEMDAENRTSVPNPFLLKSVAKETVHIQQVAMAVHVHYGVTFDVDHFCLINTAIITSLQGFTTKDALSSGAEDPALPKRHQSAGILQRPSRPASSAYGSPGRGLMCGIIEPGSDAHPSAVGASTGMVLLLGSATPPSHASSDSAMQHRSNGGGPEGMSNVALVPASHLRFPRLSAALAQAVAQRTAPPVVGAATRCGAGATVLAMPSMDTPVGKNIAKALADLFDSLVAIQQRSHTRLLAFLRTLPKQCYHPQSFATIHMLMAASAAMIPSNLDSLPDFNATGVRLAVSNIADWSLEGGAQGFLDRLPTSCSLAGAIHHLEAVTERLRIETYASWQTVMWVLQACPTELHRYLKCTWELEQPRLIENWLSINHALVSAEQQAAVAAKVRKFMRAHPPQLPRVHEVNFAARLACHPIFHIDDSMAQHRAPMRRSIGGSAGGSRVSYGGGLGMPPPRTSANGGLRRADSLSVAGGPATLAALVQHSPIGHTDGVDATASNAGSPPLPPRPPRTSAPGAVRTPTSVDVDTGLMSEHNSPVQVPRLQLPPRPAVGAPSVVLSSAPHGHQTTSSLGTTPRPPMRRNESPYAVGGPDSPSSTRRDRSTTHYVIFVHGFQGNSADLCLVKAHLALLYPYLECYSSSINEDNTGDSIQDMGARLAKEVAQLLVPAVTSTRRPLCALSFVCHSMGNLIMRAALTCLEMEPFLPLLHLYVSICGPHLGQMYSSNAVLEAGVSILKSVSSVGTCMKQLSLSDAPQVEDCFLYKLAHKSSLKAFRYIVLVSSSQDRYVPFHSSRLAMCTAAANDTRRGPAYKSMLDALLKGVGDPGRAQMLRIDVDFDFRLRGFSLGNLVNAHIGRMAHIEFIASNEYARFLAWTIQRYHMLTDVAHTWL